LHAEGPQERERQLWRLLAYLGRYGKQPASLALGMSVRDLQSLASAVNGLVKEENEANREAAEGD